MSELYSSLYSIFHGSGSLAYAAVFAWGILGMTLSPCSVATIPLVVGYIGNSDAPDFRSALKISAAFSVGVFVNLAFLGGLLTSAGLFLGGIDRYTNYIVAATFLVFGLHLLGAVNIPWFRGPSGADTKHTGIRGALVLGTVSGLALGPCSFAYSAPVILLAVSVAATDIIRALLLVASYGAGLSFVIILAGTASDLFSRLVSGRGRGAAWLEKACGLLLIAGAVYLAMTSPTLY